MRINEISKIIFRILAIDILLSPQQGSQLNKSDQILPLNY